MSNFQPLEVVNRDSETQPQVVENLNKITWQATRVNPYAADFFQTILHSFETRITNAISSSK